MESLNIEKSIDNMAAVAPEDPRPPFESTRAERWGVLGSAVVGYIYVLSIFSEHWRVWIVAFAALLCGGVALALRDERPRRECWVWLGCLWVTLLCGVLGRARVWAGESGQILALSPVGLFIHLFGAWWLMARSGRLLGAGETSRFLPLDVAHGMLATPFQNCLMRVRVLRTVRLKGKKMSPASALGAAAVGVVALLLFGLAWVLLADADPNFERMTAGIGRFFSGLDDHWFYLLLSLPVGAYLYAMVFGTRRESPEAVAARRERIESGVRALRRVPWAVWPALLGLFAALYLVFFAMQGSYLFDGLRGILPEQFTASEYARRGFFELCGVMAVNFTLLGLAAVSAEGGLRAHPATRWMSAVLLGESGLFAVTAAAKLALYIRRFGFTPLRLQSAWLVLALFAGCAAAMRALQTGRDTVKPWLMFTGITLALTMLW